MKFPVVTICSLLLFNNIQKGRSACDTPTICNHNRDLCFYCSDFLHPTDRCRLDIIEDGISTAVPRSIVGIDSYDKTVCRLSLTLTDLEDGRTQYAIAVTTKNDFTSAPLKHFGSWFVEKVPKMYNTSPTLEMTELSSESSQTETRLYQVKCEMVNTRVSLDCTGGHIIPYNKIIIDSSLIIRLTLENTKIETCHCQASTVDQIFLSDGNSQIILGTFKPISVSTRDATTCTCEAENTEDCNSIDGTCTCKPDFTGRNCELDITCHPNKFRCQSGHCVSRSWRCNGFLDCSDASDEFNCRVCNATTYGVLCDQTCTCVAENTADCHDVDGTCTCKPGFTGRNCQSDSTCLQNQFKCDDGHCIYGSYRCDDAPDCSDASDEINCQSTTSTMHSSTETSESTSSLEAIDVDTGITNSKESDDEEKGKAKEESKDEEKSKGDSFLSDERVWIPFLIIGVILIGSCAVAALYVRRKHRTRDRTSENNLSDHEGNIVDGKTSHTGLSATEVSTEDPDSGGSFSLPSTSSLLTSATSL